MKDKVEFVVLMPQIMALFSLFLQVDLDLGNYERFLDIKLTRDNNITTGKIYQVCCQNSDNFPMRLWFHASSNSSNEIHECKMLSLRNCLNFHFQSVIDKERKGDYLGKTVQVRRSSEVHCHLPFSYDLTICQLVQVVPHITDAIQEWIERVAGIPVDGEDGPADVCVIELGGTIGMVK